MNVNDASLSRTSGHDNIQQGKIAKALARKMRKRGDESKFWWLIPTLYIIFLMLPIYWLINMSFKTNNEIMSYSHCGRRTRP